MPDCNRILGRKLLHRIECTDGILSRLVDGTLVNGATSREWWSRQANGMRMDFADQMRIGVLRGETITELRNRWMPRMGEPNVDKEPDPTRRDIVRKARREAEALVRTSALTVCREASLDVFEENADVISGVQWVSTLDDRTTPLCRALDGLEWTIPGYEPKGHGTPFPGASPHWNCRSIVVPVTKTWEELAKEAGGDTEWAKRLDQATLDRVPERVRASMGGPVPAGTTYSDWFKEQDRERQLEILGPKAMDAYERKGELPFALSVSAEGNPKPLPDALGEEERAQVAKYFDERLAFVLDGIRDKYGYGPEFFTHGASMEAICADEIRGRGYPADAEKWLLDQYKDIDKTAYALALRLPNEDMEWEWVKVVVQDDAIKDRMNGVDMEHFWDGYRRYAPPLPANQAFDLLLCHEIAHAELPPDFGGNDKRGHCSLHEVKMVNLMRVLYPGFPGSHKRIR